MLKGLDYGTFTLEMEEVIGEEVVAAKTFTDLPTSPVMTAEVTASNIADSSPLNIDGDGDGETDVSLTGDEDAGGDHVLTLQLLGTAIDSMVIEPRFKQLLMKKLLLAERLLEKEKPKQAVKRLEQIRKRLESEIRRNERLQLKDEKKSAKQDTKKTKLETEIVLLQAQLDAETAAEDTADEKTFKELEKEANQDVRLQKRIERLSARLALWQQCWERWQNKKPGERIATQEAQTIITLINRILWELHE